MRSFIHSRRTKRIARRFPSSVSYSCTNLQSNIVASLAVRFASEIEHHPHPGRHLWISRVLGPTVHGRNDVRIRMRVRLERLFALRHRPLDRPRVSQSRVRFKRRAHAIPFIVKDASIDAPRQHRAKRVPATSPRASPTRQSSRPPRAIGAGRVSPSSANRAAPSSPIRRRRPRLVARRSSHLYRRIARARVVTVALIPRVVTECRDRVEARVRGRGDSLTGRDSSYIYQTSHRARESLESVRIARRDARVGDARERDEGVDRRDSISRVESEDVLARFHRSRVAREEDTAAAGRLALDRRRLE